jgi:hypothetical protein
MELGDTQLSTMLFEQFPIRRIWHNNEWYYSCVDTMAALTATPNARRYWSDLKRDIQEKEHIDMYALGVHQLPMPNNIGKIRKTDCANMQTLLRLIESVKSPRAEPIKQWLANLGAQRLDETEEKVLRLRYRRQLYQFDVALHEMVTFRGIVTKEQHERLDEANYEGLYEITGRGGSRMALVLRKHLPMTALPNPTGHPGVGPENFMGYEELGVHIFQRTQLMARTQDRDSQGEQIYDDAQDVGTEIRRTLERLGRPMPEDMPPHYPMLRVTEWLDDEEISALAQIPWSSASEDADEQYSVIYIDAPPPHEDDH